MRECDYKELPDGEVYSIKQCSGEEFDISTANGSITVNYRIIVGGPNPNQYRVNIWNMIAAFEPTLPGHVSLPPLGQTVIVQGRYFVARNIKLRLRRARGLHASRHFVATVTWESATKERDPQNQDGTPVTADDIDQAQATVSVRPGTETIPVEFARFQGFRNGKGENVACTYKNVNGVCQPLRNAIGKVVPVMNTAGVRFDPGLSKDAAVDRIVISKPFSKIPYGITKRLRRCVNNDRFFIVEFRNGVPVFGVDVAPYTARVMSATQTIERMTNGREYSVLHVELGFRNQTFEYTNELDEIEESDDYGWFDLIANRGSSMLVYPSNPDNRGGQWSSNPTKTMGGRSTVPISVDGQPDNEPQWLDCNGLPIVDTGTPSAENCVIGLQPDKLLYTMWENFRPIKFASANFPGFLGNVFFNTETSGAGSLPSSHFPDWASTGDLSGTVLELIDDFIV
jgi:hypothetical protein